MIPTTPEWKSGAFINMLGSRIMLEPNLRKVDMPLRVLFLDMNSYFASVEQQFRPELRGCPVAVAAVGVDSTCCIAASHEAKQLGIPTGTPVWQGRMGQGMRIGEAQPAP